MTIWDQTQNQSQYRSTICEVLYKYEHFAWLGKNMAAMGNSCFRLSESSKKNLLIWNYTCSNDLLVCTLKTWKSNLVRTTRFWNNLYQLRSKPTNWKSNNNNKTKTANNEWETIFLNSSISHFDLFRLQIWPPWTILVFLLFETCKIFSFIWRYNPKLFVR